ncbi:MAG: efflux transporter outer membrane subunit [Pseudomonadota bacterium]
MKLVSCLILCYLLIGCTSFAKKPDLTSLTKPSLPNLPPTWQTVQSNIGAVDVGWLDRLGDELLKDLVREALVHNRDLQAASASVDRARALAGQAKSALLPSLNYSLAGAEGGRVRDSSTDSYSSGLSLSWELDVWGRVRASRNAANYSAASAQADYVFSQYSFAAAVAQSYFLVIESKMQEEVAQKSLSALTETTRIVRSQREVGAADAYDEYLAAANMAAGEANLLQTQVAKRFARRALEILLGRYPDDRLNTVNQLPAVPPIPSAGLPSELLERRPDIIAAELTVASAFSDVGAAKAARLPTFSLTGSLDITTSRASDVLDTDAGTWSLASALLGPLFDAGLRRSQVEAADAVQRQAIANYAQIALTAFQEVENSLDQNLVIAQRVSALARSADAQNKAFNLAQLRYEEGETNLLDVLTIQSNTLSADSNLVTARRQQLDEWVNLNLALGGDWDSP